jgi:LysR family glycine cleavage system transcriptional activator
MSFTGAAIELNYTQSAISNHVRSLEKFIGRPLFVRHPRSLALTSLGKAYLPSVQSALSEIDRATESIITTLHEKKVAISCPISLAQNWLTRVISQFSDLHPDITVEIHANIWPDERDSMADIKLVSARVDEAPEDARLLWPEKLTIVCAPDYVIDGRIIDSPEALRNAQVIHILGRTAYWQDFAALYQLTDWNLASGTQTNSLTVALELAAKGQGCAILPKSLVGSYLDRGLLIEPLAVDLVSPWSCYVTKTHSGMPRHARTFHDFLIAFDAP